MLFKLLDWDNVLRLIFGFIKNVDSNYMFINI